MSDTPVVSPVPGVFYRRPSPEEAPYAEDGAQVEAGQTVGLVEIMKQFTEVKTEIAGTIEFQVEDGDMVDPGGSVAIVKAG